MCSEERNTERRARVPAARLMVRRTRPVRRVPRSLTVAIVGSYHPSCASSLPSPACGRENGSGTRFLLLALLAEDELARILDALALVGLGRPVVADIRRHLADLLLVDAGHHDLDRLRGHDGDAIGNRMDDVVAVAERDLQVLALHARPIADAGDLQPPLEALADAGDQIGDQRPRGAPQGARQLGLVARIDLDAAGLELGADVAVQNELHGALGALHLDGLAVDIGGDPRRNGDHFFPDSRHGYSPL